MSCDSCGFENNAAAKFCAECGTPLSRQCTACDAPLAPTAKFCDQCGTAVGGASPPTSPPLESEAVRKTVTVLFCDLVGSTAFGERVDAEAARSVMARYHSLARSTIESHGGTVAKFIGDGVMALFGVPEVSEDDAVRAVASGTELQTGFEALRIMVEERYESAVGLRVGINTGEIVVDATDDDVVGDAINTAARIEAACTPGEVLVGEETWRLTRSVLEYQVLGEVHVKGKAAPVATFQVTEGAIETDDLATPFVGREEQLERLRRLLSSAVEHRRLELATVIGFPGVGKTRLAAELQRSIEDEGTVLTVRCDRAVSGAWAPVRDLLLAVTRLDADAEDDEKIAALRGLFDPSVPDAERLAELLGSFIGAGEARSTEESFFALRRVLEVLGSVQPTVVVVDDIQWAEPLMLDLLEHLAEWVTGASVLVVGLARPEIRSLRPSLAEGGRRVSEVIALEGLDAEATHELAARLLGVDSLPLELVARLPESTQGNPLFVRELVRMLVDDGVLQPDGESYRLAIDAGEVDVPPTIQSLLATRVERLPADERRLVELASVVGSEFPRGALAALAPDLGRGTIELLVEQLRRKELVDPTGTYWGDEPLLRFHHVLIRDAAYRRVLKEERVRLHRAVAEWTDASMVTGAAGHGDITVGFHLEQAYRYMAELGAPTTETAELGRDAAARFHTGAKRALDQDDLDGAGSLANRALACLADDDPARRELLLLACEAYLSAGDVAQGSSAVQALRGAADHDRLDAWATAYEAQLRVLMAPDELSVAAELCETSAARLASLGDESGVARARLTRATALARLGRIGDSLDELDQALTAARAADDRRLVTAVLGAAPPAALWGPTPVPRAGGRCLDVVRLLRITSASPAVEATSVRCQGVLEALRGRFDASRDLLGSARSTAHELGLQHDLFQTELYAGMVELMAGEAELAEPLLREAYDGFSALGVGTDAGQAAAHLARSMMLQDRTEGAFPLAEEAIGLAGQNLQTSIAALAVRAELLARQERFDEAVVAATLAVDTAAETDLTVEHAAACAAQARVLKAAGRVDDAAAARRAAGQLFEAKGATIGQRVVPSDVDDRDAAVAEMYRTAHRSAPRNDLVNRATAFVVGPVLAFARGETDLAFEDLFRDDIEFVPLRRGVVSSGGGAQALREAVNSWRDAGFVPEYETLAVRGESLALVLARMARGIDEVVLVILVEVDEESRARFIGTWEEDDLAAAEQELDRRWVPDPEDGTASGPTNRASRLWVEDVADAMNGLRTLEAEDFNAPDVMFEGHRRFATAPSGGFTEAKLAFESWREMDTTVVFHAEAVRDDHLALLRSEAGGDSDERLLLYIITEIDDDGRAAYIGFWDEDDLGAAQTELDRRWVAALDGAAARTATAAIASCRAVEAADSGAVQAVLLDDFVSVDNRPGVGLGARNLEGFLEVIASRAESIGLGLLVLRDATLTSDAVLFGKFSSITRPPSAGEPVVNDGMLVFVAEGDQLSRIELYGEDERDVAASRAAHLALEAAGSAPVSAAAPVRSEGHEGPGFFDRLRQAFDSADFDGMASLIHPDCQPELRRSGVAGGWGSASDIVGTCRFWRERDWTLTGHTLESQPEAELVRYTFSAPDDSTEVPLVAIFELGVDGRWVGGTIWDAEDLDTARAEFASRFMDDRWREPDGRLPDNAASSTKNFAERVVDEWEPKFTADPAAWERRIAPGMERHDRQSNLALGVANRDQFVASIREVRARGGVVTRRGITLATRGDNLMASRWGIVYPDGFEGFGITICRVNEVGLVDLLVQLDEDAVEEMEAELDRLAGDGALHRNTSVAALERLLAEMTPETLESVLRAGLAEDYVRVDRRSVVSSAPVDRDGQIEAQRSAYEIGFDVGVPRLVATRGERLSLHEVAFIGEGGFDAPFLLLCRVNEGGRIDRTMYFSREDLPAAIAQLDRLQLGESARESATGRLNSCSILALRMLTEVSLSDTSVWLEVIAHDAVRLDMRSVSAAPDSEGRADLLQLLKSTFETGLQFGPFSILRQRGDGLSLLDMSYVGLRGEEVRFLNLLAVGGDNKINRSWLFDTEDSSSAFALLDELWREQPSAPSARPQTQLDNTGAAVFRQYLLGVTPDTIERLGNLMFSESFQRFDHRAGVSMPPVDRAGWIEASRSVIEVGMLPTADIETVATRGERHFATRMRLAGSNAEVEVIVVGNLDASGRFERFDFFDVAQVDSAHDELERRGGDAASEHVVESLRLLAVGEIERLAELMAPDIRQEVRRRGAHGPSGGVGAILETLRYWRDEGWSMTGTVLATRAGRLVLHEGAFRSPDGADVIPLVWVTELNERGLAALTIAWDLEDEGLAVQEFFRRADVAPSRPQVASDRALPAGSHAASGQLVNSMTQLLAEIRAIHQRGETAEHLLSGSWTRVDRRSGITAPVADRATYIEQVRPAMRAIGSDDVSYEPLADRGDSFALGVTTWHLDHDSEVEFLQVSGRDDQGLFSDCVYFDLEDEDGAYLELDRLWLASLDAADATAAQNLIDLTEAACAGDGPRTAAAAASDFTIDDRRPTGFGLRDRQGFVDASAARLRTTGSAAVRFFRLERPSPGLFLTQVRLTSTAPDTGAEVVSEIATAVYCRDGWVRHVVQVDPSDWSTLVELAETWTEHPPH